MLRAIAIRRLRGIKEGLVEDLKQVNVLVGRNGAGKSTILEAVYLASACAQRRDPLRSIDKLDYVIGRRGGRGNWENARKTLWYTAEVEKPIEIVLHVQSPEGVKEYEFHIGFGTTYPFASRPALVKDRETGLYLNLEENYVWDDKLMRWRSITLFESIAARAKDYDRLKALLANVLLVDNRLLTNHLDLLERNLWSDLVMKRLDKELAKLVNSVLLTNVESFSYVPLSGNFQMFAMLPSGSVRIEDLGDGVLRALQMSMVALAVRPSILLIEEPEIQLHPGGLLKFMKFILKLAKEKNFQVIMTTHSAEAVSIIANACTSPELGIECSIKYVEREDGILRVENLDPEDLEALERLGLDVRYLGVL